MLLLLLHAGLLACAAAGAGGVAPPQHQHPQNQRRTEATTYAAASLRRRHRLEEGDGGAVLDDEGDVVAPPSNNSTVPPPHDHGDWPEPSAEDNAYAKYVQDQAAAGGRAGGAYDDLVQPVAFHVIHMADGTGKVPYDQLVKQVAQLNRAFSSQEARNAGYGKATDAHISFTLHSVDYTENDDWHRMCCLFNYQAIIKQALAVDPARVYNVYVCYAAASLGLSWLPYQAYRAPGERDLVKLSEGHWMLGSIVYYTLLPGNNVFGGRWGQGDILVHETGHAYGLKHIYEGGCIGDESISDMIDDTPRQNGNNQGDCNSLAGLDSCPNNPGKDDNQNYMGVAADSCRSHFTPGQVAFMRNTIDQLKPTLARQAPPPCVAAISPSDNSPDLRPCTGAVSTRGKGGRAWCPTSKTDQSLWGWACCPEDGDSCRTGRFSLDVNTGATDPPTSNGDGGGSLCGNWIVDGGDTPCQIPFKVKVGSRTQTFNEPVSIGTVSPFQWTARDGVSADTLWCPFQGVNTYNAKSRSTRASWGSATCV